MRASHFVIVRASFNAHLVAIFFSPVRRNPKLATNLPNLDCALSHDFSAREIVGQQ